MSQPFGNLITQFLSRKHGLSQNKLALGIHCDNTLISRMCNGERLSTPSARAHIIDMIEWFLDQDVLRNLDEANALLDAAYAAGLRNEKPKEEEIINRLIKLESDLSVKNYTGQVNISRPARLPINNLPYPYYENFIGREAELNKIIQYIRPGSESERYIYPVSIDGIGGIGKSSLALAIGYYFCNNYRSKNFENIIWVSAKEEWFLPAGLAPKSVKVYKTLYEILRVIGKILEFSDILEAKSKSDWVEIVYQQLQKKPTLLIIDNLETIDDDSVISFIQELPPPTKAILTTRRRIDITYSIRLEEMTKEDAVKLIDQRSVDSILTYKQKEQLYERTGGVPLILIWSMAQINSGMSIDVLLKKIETSHIKDIAKYCFEQNIITIKEHSYYYDLLQALSIFETGATRFTIGHVAGLAANEISRDDGLIFLEKLAMLTRNGDQFTMLPLTRSYLSDLLEEDHKCKRQILQNLVDWVKNIITANTNLDANSIEYLDNEHRVLLKATEHCIDQKDYYTAKEIISFVRKQGSHFQDLEWGQQLEKLEEVSAIIKLPKIDWDGAPNTSYFYGRADESKKLTDWVALERCRLISIVGFGGMGKSSLAINVARSISQEYDYVIWRSLANGPLPNELFLQLLQVLIESPNEAIPENPDEKLDLLTNYFTRYKCLIILDNFETILTKGGSDKLLSGYECYERLLDNFGKTSNRSCLLITSREKPSVLLNLELNNSKVRSLNIEGLKKSDLEILLADENIQAKDELLFALIHRYNGSPLAAKWVVNLLKEEIYDDMIEIINSKALPRNINNLIDEEIERLSVVEKEVLTWLAIERDPINLITLSNNILPEEFRHNIQVTVEHLDRRSLISLVNKQIVLQPFLVDYIIDNLVSDIVEEILSEKINKFYNFALLKAQAKDPIRNTHGLFIVEPIVQKLISFLGNKQDFVNKLNRILEIVKNKPKELQGYAVGNILNLLTQVNHHLDQYDFSNTNVCQALLQSTNLHSVNFFQSHFRDTVFAELFDVVLTVAISPDKNVIATGTVNGEIILWDGILSKQIEVLKGHKGWVRSVVFHPTKSNILASGAADHSVRLWNLETGDVQILIGHTDWVRSVVFSPDGSVVASAGSEGKVILWELATGKIIKSFDGHTDWIWSICFSNTGDHIISGSNDNTVRISHIQTGTVQILSHQNNRIKTVAYSPLGEFIVCGGSDNHIYVWNAKTGELMHILKGHNNHIWCLKFSNNGKYLFSGSKDKTITIWDVNDWSVNKVLSGQNGYITSIDSSLSENILVSGGTDQMLRLWDIQTGQCIRRIEGKSNNINAVSFQSKENLIAWGGADCIVHVWDYAKEAHKISLNGHNSRIKALSFSHNNVLIASGSDDQTVKIWDVKSGIVKQTLRGHLAWVLSVTFAPDDKVVASGSDDFSARLWSVETGECMKVLKGENFIYSLAFSANGKILASGGADKRIWLWDVATGGVIKKLEGHTLRINSLAYSANNFIVSGSDDRTVRLWSPDTGECIKVLNGHDGPIRSVCFDPSGKFVVSCGDDKTARIWNLSGECINVIESDDNYLSSALNQTGDLLALSGTKGIVNFWSLKDNKFIMKLKTNRIYENMNIANVTGLTSMQKENLKILGAVE